MNKYLNLYCQKIKKGFDSKIYTEHSYRADLQSLFHNIVKNIEVTNEPKRQACGAPDYIVQKKDVPIGYIEAKDIGIDLNRVEKSNQLKRYLESLDNLILTDYLEFRFFKLGKKVLTIKIAEIQKDKFLAISENFDAFINHLTDFCAFRGQTIKSVEKLAKMMARKGRLIEEVIYKIIKKTEITDPDNTLHEQFVAIQKTLIHDLTEKEFADIYAQTIVYGLFAARLNDKTLDSFSRQKALFLVPKSNPFLTQLFSYIAGPNLDYRLVWIINDLADIFRATDIQTLLKDFGKITQQNDPFIHFYETFLGEYDSITKKNRGVFYTPEPAVKFIVRAVDDILQTDFNLQKGIANSEKINIDVEENGENIRKQTHKVQILDPAAGTGTFLVEVVKQISKKFQNQKGAWQDYVENELIPRVNGFEILMASYTICHLKLDILLRETGYEPENKNQPQRLRVFLTDSLEEAHPDVKMLFASWLSREAEAANFIKTKAPIMVVLGNPPYANFGLMNKGKWILNLINDYKKGLNESKINIDNDYVKFIRYGEHFIEKNGEGILAYINDNSFLDSITFRQMRKHLFDTFDKIYILNLHGNSRIKEVSPDGTKDENIFDIQQGVSINIFVKTGKKKEDELSELFYCDIFGKRKNKAQLLSSNSLKTVKWKKLKPKKENYFFVPKEFKGKKEYEKGFSIKDIFKKFGSGIKTDRDSLFFDINKNILKNRMKTFYTLEGITSPFKENYQIEDSSSYNLIERRKNTFFDEKYIQNCLYRPFDIRKIYYKTSLISRPGKKVMKHLLNQNNVALLLSRLMPQNQHWNRVFVSKNITDIHAITDQTYVFPLYLYESESREKNTGAGLATVLMLFEPEADYNVKRSNFKTEFVSEFSNRLKLSFVIDKLRNNQLKNIFDSEDIFDYIYAALHSVSYREKFDEYLKIDFPRIPYPKTKKDFWRLVKFGNELRQLHLLEAPILENFITSYPEKGNNIIERDIVKKDFEIIDKKNNFGRIWINETQYFDKIPINIWETYVGSYQPAQKWLKDRKGRKLNYDDIIHYQKIIVSLTETDKIMNKIKLL